MKDWNNLFSKWAKPPGKTEEDRCENAIRAIKDALLRSPLLEKKDIQVFVQGSFRNRVNVRQESDIDVGVSCRDVFFTTYPPGVSDTDTGNKPSDYSFQEFKNDVHEALTRHFGEHAVRRGSKAFDVSSNSYRVEADVAPFFPYRLYTSSKTFHEGMKMYSDSGDPIVNWPEQHYANGVQKNTQTARRYKQYVRIMKKLALEMQHDGVQASVLPGFFLECLTWNCNESLFLPDHHQGVRACLSHLFTQLKKQESHDWCEVSELKYLFSQSQKWSKDQAVDFILAAASYIGMK